MASSTLIPITMDTVTVDEIREACAVDILTVMATSPRRKKHLPLHRGSAPWLLRKTWMATKNSPSTNCCCSTTCQEYLKNNLDLYVKKECLSSKIFSRRTNAPPRPSSVRRAILFKHSGLCDVSYFVNADGEVRYHSCTIHTTTKRRVNGMTRAYMAVRDTCRSVDAAGNADAVRATFPSSQRAACAPQSLLGGKRW